MLTKIFELAFADDADLPAANASDYALVRWLHQRLGSPPSWFEVLALRAGLRERARRLVRWAWWRRLRRAAPPSRECLVADFLRSPEGEMLLRMVGGMTLLLAQLALTDPWYGYDGRHPRAQRQSRREVVLERMARGGAVPLREQRAAILAYADWKLAGLGDIENVFVAAAVEFLLPTHAAAINSMSVAAVMGICTRLRRPGTGDAGRPTVLRELDHAGAEALRLWPGIGRRVSGPPRGLWPVPDEAEDPEEASPTLTQVPALGA